MHGLIKERLENYLLGASERKLPLELEQHLRSCPECRDEVNCMQEQAQVLRALASPRKLEPPAGFYARVMARIEAQQSNSIWSAFLDPIFARRLATAGLAVALVLGGFLAFTEAESFQQPAAAEAIMAVPEHPPGLGQDRQRDRETILVTLASYKE